MKGNILTNRSAVDRSERDFYPTPKEATIALLNYLNIPPRLVIWEPACGTGEMAETIKERGYNVIATDLYNTGYGASGIDFLKSEQYTYGSWCDWIITNPPFSSPRGISQEFIKKCIGYKKPFALLFKSQYWHARERVDVFKNHKPRLVLPLTWRPDFLNGAKGGSPTMECIWTVWGTEPAEKTEYALLEKPVI